MRGLFFRWTYAIYLLLAMCFGVQSPNYAKAESVPASPLLAINLAENKAVAITPTLQSSIALTQILPINQTVYQLQWDNNQSVSVHLDSKFNSEQKCQDEIRLGYSLATSSTFTKTIICRSNEISITLQNRQRLTGEVKEQITSPNKKMALLIEEVLTPTLKTVLGNSSPVFSGAHYEQIWLASKSGALRPLFYTGQQFIYEWAKDNRHILAWSSCFGAVGAYTVDILSGKIAILSKNNQACEDGTSFQISPDSRNILYGNGIVTNWAGTRQIHICDKDEFARSYAWSSDGRYAYATCYKGNSTDSLRRYDSRLGKTTTLIDRSVLIFKAYRLAIAPDNKRVAYAWGDGVMHPNFQGVWVIDLAKSP